MISADTSSVQATFEWMQERLGHLIPDIELRLCSHRCPHMAQITLEDTLAALEQNRYEVTVPDDIRVRAKASIDRMLAIG